MCWYRYRYRYRYGYGYGYWLRPWHWRGRGWLRFRTGSADPLNRQRSEACDVGGGQAGEQRYEPERRLVCGLSLDRQLPGVLPPIGTAGWACSPSPGNAPLSGASGMLGRSGSRGSSTRADKPMAPITATAGQTQSRCQASCEPSRGRWCGWRLDCEAHYRGLKRRWLALSTIGPSEHLALVTRALTPNGTGGDGSKRLTGGSRRVSRLPSDPGSDPGQGR